MKNCVTPSSFLRGGGRTVYTPFPVTDWDPEPFSGSRDQAEEKEVVFQQEYKFYSMGECPLFY
jgi:hypothetical protein